MNTKTYEGERSTERNSIRPKNVKIENAMRRPKIRERQKKNNRQMDSLFGSTYTCSTDTPRPCRGLHQLDIFEIVNRSALQRDNVPLILWVMKSAMDKHKLQTRCPLRTVRRLVFCGLFLV